MTVLRERPNARVTALDIFAAGYGIDGNTPERLERNAAAAGGVDRLTIVTGGMRAMTLAGDSFEGVVSSFAIDHVSQEDVKKALGALAEAGFELIEVGHQPGTLYLLARSPD